MIVDDDEGRDYEKFYFESLPNLSKSYHVWEVESNGVPAMADILRFPRRTVIWYTGDDSSTVTQVEQDILLEHINSGGRLFLTGQNIAEQLDGSALLNQLGLSFAQNIGIPIITGVNGEDTDGLIVTSAGSGGANNQTSRDRLALTDSTTTKSIFTYGNNANAIAGTVIEQNSTRIVFFGFGFEAIGNSANREQVMDLVMNYLDSTVTSIDENPLTAAIPENFELSQNFPNPFNPSTTISFSLPANAPVTVAIFNTLGQQIKTLMSGHITAGKHDVVWDGKDEAGNAVTSGIYFYRLTSGQNFTDMKKMILLR